MPKLEREESALQRREHEGIGLKILPPKQMHSRLPISLAQLKAGNNSQKLKNEIRQILYSLYRSKKLSNEYYFDEYYLKMETPFANTSKSKKNKPNKFMYQFTDKLNLKNPNKNMALANLSIYYTWKTLSQYTTTINLQYMFQLGMMQ